MLTILAAVVILLGLYLIVSGLREGERYRVRHEEPEEEEQKRKAEVRGGGVVLIGPIPIVFGDSKYAVISLFLAIVLMLLSIFLLFSLH